MKNLWKIALVTLLCGALLAGCGKEKEETKPESTPESSSNSIDQSSKDALLKEKEEERKKLEEEAKKEMENSSKDTSSESSKPKETVAGSTLGEKDGDHYILDTELFTVKVPEALMYSQKEDSEVGTLYSNDDASNINMMLVGNIDFSSFGILGENGQLTEDLANEMFKGFVEGVLSSDERIVTEVRVPMKQIEIAGTTGYRMEYNFNGPTGPNRPLVMVVAMINNKQVLICSMNVEDKYEQQLNDFDKMIASITAN